ncbi:MAG: endonuclease [Candidatus Symbiothrix sp.]|jgi:endonuclease I|nr:endonuclease [Candidatus Symbiothrix sp.]
MKSIFHLIIAFLLLPALLSAQIPEGYYSTIDGKQQRAIKTALHLILKNHSVLSYNDLWYYFHTTDVHADGRTVWDMYSNTVRYFNSNPYGSTSDMNKEHSLPKSWWAVSSEVSKYDAYSDLNHLYPSDGAANIAKSNYMLGEVASPTFDNGVSKIGANAYNFQAVSTAKAFEPADEYKGDFARTYFYMITCYEDYADYWRSDALNMFNKETYPVLKPWAQAMLLQWHRQDAVSQKEIDRNNAVWGYQQNRNPFIDFPQLVEYIWGDSIDYPFALPENLIPVGPALITPTANSTEIYFGDIRKDAEVERTVALKGVGLTGNLSITLFSNASGYFSTNVTSVSAASVNAESGYSLKISYNPKDYGEHSALLVLSDGGISGSVAVPLKGVCSSADAIVPVGSSYADLYTNGRDIAYRTYAAGDRVRIANVQGQYLLDRPSNGHWETFTLPNAGVYIIFINNQSRKIIIQ